MGQADYSSVLERAAIERGGKLWAWTIPIMLPIAEGEVARCQAGVLCGSRYGFYKLTFNRTATAIRVMIDGMINQMRHPSDYKRSLSFQNSIDDAAIRFSLLAVSFDKLLAHMDGKPSGTEPSDLQGRIDAAQEHLKEAFDTLVQHYRKSGAARRRQILAELKGVSWLRFEEIRPIATAGKETG